jgi:hypothetical protein
VWVAEVLLPPLLPLEPELELELAPQADRNEKAHTYAVRSQETHDVDTMVLRPATTVPQ